MAGDDVFQQFVEFIQKSDPDRQLEERELRKLYARFQLWKLTQ